MSNVQNNKKSEKTRFRMSAGVCIVLGIVLALIIKNMKVGLVLGLLLGVLGGGLLNRGR